MKDLSPAVQPIESNNRKKKRKFLSEAAARPIVLNLQRLSPTPAQNSSNSQGKTPDKNEADFIEAKPNAKESSSSPVRSCDQKRDHSKSPNRRKTPDGVRPTSSRSRSPVIIRSSSSPSLPSESANSRSRNSKRSSEAKQPLVRVVTPKVSSVCFLCFLLIACHFGFSSCHTYLLISLVAVARVRNRAL